MIQADYCSEVKPKENHKLNPYYKGYIKQKAILYVHSKGKDMVFHDEKPWNGILASNIFTLHATEYTKT